MSLPKWVEYINERYFLLLPQTQRHHKGSGNTF